MKTHTSDRITPYDLHVMTSTDSTLHHCVQLTCPKCGHMVRVARCQCDLDAEHLVAVYQRDILLYCLTCPKCHKAYDDPESAKAVNRVHEDRDAEDLKYCGYDVKISPVAKEGQA